MPAVWNIPGLAAGARRNAVPRKPREGTMLAFARSLWLEARGPTCHNGTARTDGSNVKAG